MKLVDDEGLTRLGALAFVAATAALSVPVFFLLELWERR